MTDKQIPCSTPNCGAEPMAKGLCGKHYMRLRRHGDPGKALKRGPKSSKGSFRGVIRSLLSDHSTRSLERRIRAKTLNEKLMHFLGADSYYTTAIKLASRPNGSVNFSQLLLIMENRAAELISHLPR